MRKIIALCALALGLAGVTAAQADNGAVHYVSCPDTTFVSNLGGFSFEYCFSDVATSSGNANAQFHGKVLDGVTPPDKAVTVRGFSCSAAYPAGGFTSDTRVVITPSGEVNGSCKFHPEA